MKRGIFKNDLPLKKSPLYSAGGLTIGCSYPIIALNVASNATLPYLVSMLNRDKSLLSVALLSPCVSAPNDSSLLATMLANLESSIMSIYQNPILLLNILLLKFSVSSFDFNNKECRLRQAYLSI